MRRKAVSGTEVFCIVCCCPCVLLSHGLKRCFRAIKPKKSYEERAYRTRQKNAPRPRPRRRRRLTLPLDSKPTKFPFRTSQKTNNQFQSLIFSLPLELREEIWNYAIGYMIIHISSEHKKFRHAVCSHCIVTDHWVNSRVPLYSSCIQLYPENTGPQDCGLLALSKMCRRMWV